MEPTIYAYFDENGFISGFYEDDVFPDVVEYGEVPEATEENPLPKAPEISRTRNPRIPPSAIVIDNATRMKIASEPMFWRLVDGNIVPHIPEVVIHVPNEVTNYQARAALINAGLFEIADQRIRSSGNKIAIQAWDYANVFYRQSPIILWMGEGLELTESQIDDLFIEASKIL